MNVNLLNVINSWTNGPDTIFYSQKKIPLYKMITSTINIPILIEKNYIMYKIVIEINKN